MKARKKHNKKHELDSIKAKFANGEPSDHLMFVNVIHQWEEAFESGTNQQFCRKNYLNEKVLDGIYKIKQQVKERLDKMDILGNPTDLEQNSTNFRLIKAILAYAFYPLVKPRGLDNKLRFTFLNEGNGKRIYVRTHHMFFTNPEFSIYSLINIRQIYICLNYAIK